jgi:hypothetical protein
MLQVFLGGYTMFTGKRFIDVSKTLGNEDKYLPLDVRKHPRIPNFSISHTREAIA